MSNNIWTIPLKPKYNFELCYLLSILIHNSIVSIDHNQSWGKGPSLSFLNFRRGSSCFCLLSLKQKIGCKCRSTLTITPITLSYVQQHPGTELTLLLPHEF